MGSWPGFCLLLRGGGGKDKTPLLLVRRYTAGQVYLLNGLESGTGPKRCAPSPLRNYPSEVQKIRGCRSVRTEFNWTYGVAPRALGRQDAFRLQWRDFSSPPCIIIRRGGAKETWWTRVGSKSLDLRRLGGSRWEVRAEFLRSRQERSVIILRNVLPGGDNRYAGSERRRAEGSLDLTKAEKAESSGRVCLARSWLRRPIRDDPSGEAKFAVDRVVSQRLFSPLGH